MHWRANSTPLFPTLKALLRIFGGTEVWGLASMCKGQHNNAGLRLGFQIVAIKSSARAVQIVQSGVTRQAADQLHHTNKPQSWSTIRPEPAQSLN